MAKVVGSRGAGGAGAPEEPDTGEARYRPGVRGPGRPTIMSLNIHCVSTRFLRYLRGGWGVRGPGRVPALTGSHIRYTCKRVVVSNGLDDRAQTSQRLQWVFARVQTALLAFAFCTKSAMLDSRPLALGLNNTLWEAGLRFC